MDTDSFITNIKTEDVYEEIADDVEEGFDTSNYECNSIKVNRLIPIRKNKKKMGLITHQIMNAIPLKSIDQYL